MTQELKPCPFCANSAHLCDDLITFYAQCDSCTASGALSSYSTGAAIAWNTRALTAAQPAQAAGSQWCDHCGRVVIASCGSNDHATRCILGLTQPAQAGEVDAREAFERAALAKWGPLDFERSEAVPEMYYNQRLDDAWIGFGFAVTWLRASLPASQQATPEPVGEPVAWRISSTGEDDLGSWLDEHAPGFDPKRDGVPHLRYEPLYTRPAAAPAAPEGFAQEAMTSKWCWWFGDGERFQIVDTESEAHGEAQSYIDDDADSGEERAYSIARVQHPIDALGMDWLALHVAESIAENVCCCCDDYTGAEEPSIMLSPDDSKALGLMVATFLRQRVGVDWWTADQKTVTQHTYVAGSNDALAAAQANGEQA